MKEYVSERDWVADVRLVIASRSDFVQRGLTGYPVELQQLESDLVRRDIRLKPVDAAMAFLCWVMSRASIDHSFILAQRKTARMCAEISGTKLDDDYHAQVLGNAGISKLCRTGVIEILNVPMTLMKTGDRKERFLTYRWAFVPPSSSPETEQHHAR